MQGAWIRSLVWELDPICYNEDPVQPNKLKKKKILPRPLPGRQVPDGSLSLGFRFLTSGGGIMSSLIDRHQRHKISVKSRVSSRCSLKGAVIVLIIKGEIPSPIPARSFFIICCSVAQPCPALCDPMDCSTPDFPVLHHLLEFAQTHVHQVSDAIQPSHPLSSPLLLPSIFPIIRVYFNEPALHNR